VPCSQRARKCAAHSATGAPSSCGSVRCAGGGHRGGRFEAGVPKETEVDITRLHYGEHRRVGTIAAQLGIHPDVVKRVLSHKQASCDPVRRPSLVQPFQNFIRQTLEQYPALPATRLS